MKRALTVVAALCSFALPVMAQENGPSNVVEQFSRAWDRSDAKGISNLFALDADFIASDGSFAKGRAAIKSYYAAAFLEGFTGSKGIGEVIQQRSISPELALLDARFTIRGAHNPNGSQLADEQGLMVAVLRRQGSSWQIVALRERGGGALAPFPVGSR